MTKQTTLEQLQEMNEKRKGIESIIQAHEENPKNPKVYDAIIGTFVKETGTPDPRRDPNDPNKILQVEDMDVARMGIALSELYEERIKSYMTPSHLKQILNELDYEQVRNLAIECPPKTIERRIPRLLGKSTHNRIASKHKKYLTYRTVEFAARSENPEQRRAAFEAIYKELPKSTEEMLKEKKMTKKEIELLSETINYLALRHSGYALQIYSLNTKRAQEDLMSELKEISRIKQYIRGNVYKATDDERSRFYRILCEIAKKQDKKK